LPSNLEIAVKLLEYALLMEGDEYWERLMKLRRDGFILMSDLSKFRPRLIGSVWRGIVKPSSDIDVELDFTNPELVRHELIRNSYEILEEGEITVPKPLRQGSLWKMKVRTKLGHEAEIILKEHKWYINPPRCEIFGDVRKGLNLMELKVVLRREPDKLFIPEEGCRDGD